MFWACLFVTMVVNAHVYSRLVDKIEFLLCLTTSAMDCSLERQNNHKQIHNTLNVFFIKKVSKASYVQISIVEKYTLNKCNW